jgi:hypothetical protein
VADGNGDALSFSFDVRRQFYCAGKKAANFVQLAFAVMAANDIIGPFQPGKF